MYGDTPPRVVTVDVPLVKAAPKRVARLLQAELARQPCWIVTPQVAGADEALESLGLRLPTGTVGTVPRQPAAFMHGDLDDAVALAIDLGSPLVELWTDAELEEDELPMPVRILAHDHGITLRCRCVTAEPLHSAAA